MKAMNLDETHWSLYLYSKIFSQAKALLSSAEEIWKSPQMKSEPSRITVYSGKYKTSQTAPLWMNVFLKCSRNHKTEKGSQIWEGKCDWCIKTMHSIYSREGNFEDANLVIWIDFIHFKEAIQIVIVRCNKNGWGQHRWGIGCT